MDKWIALAVSAIGLLVAVGQFTIVSQNRTQPYKATIFERSTAAAWRVIESSHAACNEMAATVRRVQRVGSTDPSTIESTWDRFLNARSFAHIAMAEETIEAYDKLQDELLEVRKIFLTWKRSGARETYNQADVRATKLQERCVAAVAEYVNYIRVGHGLDKLGGELFGPYKARLGELYAGGGDGGGN